MLTSTAYGIMTKMLSMLEQVIVSADQVDVLSAAV